MLFLENKENRLKRRIVICDSCRDAASEEGAETSEMQETICVTLGNEIPDHTCEAREEPGTRCDCLCNQKE